MEEMGNACKNLAKKPEGKRPRGRPTYRIGNNIKTDPIHMAQYGSGHGPVAGSCKHGNEPLGSIKGKELLN